MFRSEFYLTNRTSVFHCSSDSRWMGDASAVYSVLKFMSQLGYTQIERYTLQPPGYCHNLMVIYPIGVQRSDHPASCSPRKWAEIHKSARLHSKQTTYPMPGGFIIC